MPGRMPMALKIMAICWGLALGAVGAAANPYSAALTVNDSAVTVYDIDQRIMLLEALGGSGDLREQAVEQLTEDRLKIQAGKEIGLEHDEGMIQAGLEEFAGQRGLAADDVLQILDARGIDRQTMDDFVAANIIWREVLGTRFRARSMPSEEDLDAALSLAATTPLEVYQLAEIALPFAERGEQETIAFAEQLHRDLSRGASFAAAVRQFSRSSSAERGGMVEPIPGDQIPPALRTQVLLLRPGQITRPIPIPGGVALLQLVSISQQPPQPIAEDDIAAREALRLRIFNERISTFGQGYLQELLADALIVVR